MTSCRLYYIHSRIIRNLGLQTVFAVDGAQTEERTIGPRSDSGLPFDGYPLFRTGRKAYHTPCPLAKTISVCRGNFNTRF